jgi:hypothetical protein
MHNEQSAAIEKKAISTSEPKFITLTLGSLSRFAGLG